MSKVLEERDKAIHDSLISRDKFWLDSLESYNHYMKSMSYEQVNIGKTMESIALTQVELIKENVKILDWAMATVSSKKKKFPVPKITISDYIPYVIQPPYEHAFIGPLVCLRSPQDLKKTKRKIIENKPILYFQS